MVNKKLFDALLVLHDHGSDFNFNQNILDELNQKGFINGRNITNTGYALLENHRINNAIILAAGISSRFVPICFDKPKGLLEVKGEILVERQIRQLKEIGINEIIIVVGYKKEQFYYLKKKYNIIIIETDDFSIKNNYASVYAARNYLKNTIITSSDLYFKKNIFQLYAYDSYYCSIFIKGDTEERGLVIDENDKIIDTFYNCHDIWVSLGYAFFSERFSQKYIEIVSEINNDPKSYNKFWADIQDDHLADLYMYIKKCNKDDIYEFDSLKELYDFQPDFNGCRSSNTLKYICSIFHCNETQLYNFSPVSMKGNIKICSFRFSRYLYYLCIYPNQYIDINDVYETMKNLKFKFVSVDIANNRAILTIQEEYND
ncbi:MAG: NTP transferase domain-containing protein [Bacteroidales bacterium]|jgi:CTP:phosphocholine cytidylyltransferase-like protein|nr:NTP transferase domain-containing protein [Bacteroidales bacterium]